MKIHILHYITHILSVKEENTEISSKPNPVHSTNSIFSDIYLSISLTMIYPH